jgi:putative nucleotidyltransferase with HDIG domain
MKDPAGFLHAFAQALSAMTLYPGAHPSRGRAIDAAYRGLDGLVDTQPAVFTFLDGDVIYGREQLRDMKEWDWARRLVAAGVERLEFKRRVGREELESFLQQILARLTLSAIETSENQQMQAAGIRFGTVGLQGEQAPGAAEAQPAAARADLSLAEEIETIRWLQREVQSQGSIPLLEAEAVVRSLSMAMHCDRRMVLPLLQLKEFDQYTTTHSLNVAVLAMGLAENLGCAAGEVRAFGVAGLLHDIGKIRIPMELLTKPGTLTAEERLIMNRHPVDGAQLIMQSDEDLDLAAVVAYEHHVMLNGGGYPRMHYRRPCALASRLVHVCDVFDALRTKRPYRDAWESERIFAYLLERAGTEFDPDLVTAFVRMLREGEARVNIVTEEPTATAA